MAVLLGSCQHDTILRAPPPAAAALAASSAESTAAIDALCAQAELSRAPSSPVRALLGSSSIDARARAALAAGRLADAAAVPALGALLAQPHRDGTLAAWALGRMPHDRAAEALLRDCLHTNCPADEAAARALGSQPREPATLAELSRALSGSAPVAAAAGLALGALARSGEKGADAQVASAARASLWLALARRETEVRRAAAYALGRIPRADPKAATALSDGEHAALLAALRDADPETRATAARAAGKQGLPAPDFALLLADLDWRVRVEVAHSLSQAPGGGELIGPAIRISAQLLERAQGKADARWAHPLVQLFASAVALKLPRGELPEPRTLRAPTTAATAAVRCAAADARDRAAQAVLETPLCAAGLEPPWRSRFRTAALAGELAGDHPESPAGQLLLATLVDTDPRVRSAAAGSASPAFADALVERLDDPDPFVLGSAAGSLAKDAAAARRSLPAAARAARRFSDARSAATGDARADALAALASLFAAAFAPPVPASAAADTATESSAVSLSVPQVDRPAVRALFALDGPPPASISLLHSLAELRAALGGAPASAANATPPAEPVFAPALPVESQAGRAGRGPRAQTLVLETTAGELRAHLFSADGEAPLTTAALAALANRGFYDGLSFHRVVPDFVAQGGDPFGDGEGGPGWALPDEHTALHFDRGTLGIATSGPETGGSQFFFCHSAQPHLDGRYTVAGQLEGGDDVLDALQVGDVILRAHAE